ncbi:hypothetical protein SETIT_2G406900v2 [Setaria italica]|uniref:Uncharacterized protein n=1 Tax=Setaria italica TaxID=4555 RepID=A0A368Q918_SETIT|nr:hypothetical protein SETIT_2G406900v2 [Setaria italica]
MSRSGSEEAAAASGAPHAASTATMRRAIAPPGAMQPVRGHRPRSRALGPKCPVPGRVPRLQGRPLEAGPPQCRVLYERAWNEQWVVCFCDTVSQSILLRFTRLVKWPGYVVKLFGTEDYVCALQLACPDLGGAACSVLTATDVSSAAGMVLL